MCVCGVGGGGGGGEMEKRGKSELGMEEKCIQSKREKQ